MIFDFGFWILDFSANPRGHLLTSPTEFFNAIVMVGGPVKQPVVKNNTKEEIVASVWSISHVVTGPPTSAPAHVWSSLETMLTTLATDWYQDNPSK